MKTLIECDVQEEHQKRLPKDSYRKVYIELEEEFSAVKELLKTHERVEATQKNVAHRRKKLSHEK